MILNWETIMNKYLIILLGVLFFGCREEFWPSIDKYENLLVVDGSITNQPGPYTIRLSSSTLVQDASFHPFEGALVKIYDDFGNEEILNEIEPGVYQTSASGIKGQVGRAYKLVINTPDERYYESAFSKIQEPIGIDSVYTLIESKPTNDPEFYYWGYQFYLDTKVADHDSVNFLWQLNATYEYRSDFLIRYYFDGQLHPMDDPYSFWRCWIDDNVGSNFTASTDYLAEPVIKGYPLIFVNTETRKLSVRYSLKVSQFIVDRDAFNYFDQIKNINDEQGTLFTSLPYQVRGNLRNINDESEPVLGYFLVGGQSEKRIFVNPPYINKFRYSVCELGEEDYQNVGSIYYSDPKAYPIFITYDINYALALPAQACMDCRLKGGTINKPDFWIDY
jgi:hypothetical protein